MCADKNGDVNEIHMRSKVEMVFCVCGLECDRQTQVECKNRSLIDICDNLSKEHKVATKKKL